MSSQQDGLQGPSGSLQDFIAQQEKIFIERQPESARMAGLAGHAHPAIVEAVRGQVGLGPHFGRPGRQGLRQAGHPAIAPP